MGRISRWERGCTALQAKAQWFARWGGATAAKPRDGKQRSMTETTLNGGFAAGIRTAMAASGAHSCDRSERGWRVQRRRRHDATVVAEGDGGARRAQRWPFRAARRGGGNGGDNGDWWWAAKR
ncbi:hypothetical protein SESBI_01851 [Sesbania bispinosa]|nr:hypothetical protein SESBI_01851 [Sesbania bispinosa]